MSGLYSFKSAADNVPLFLDETIVLARAVYADPVNADHVEPILGLSGCVNKAIQGLPDIGPFGATDTMPTETAEECCAEIIRLCEQERSFGGPYGGSGMIWALLAPLLARLLDRVIDRITEED